MIVMRLKGGMGNQMFQYALGRQLAHQLNVDLALDLSSLLDRSKGDFVYRNYDLSIFKVQEKFVTKPQRIQFFHSFKSSSLSKVIRDFPLRGRTYIKEAHFHFQPEILKNTRDNTLLEGWFQSPKYFSDIEEELRRDFSFKKPVLPKSEALLERIKSSNSICLNVRRTDFLQVDNLNTTSLDYFLQAAKLMAEKVDNPHFYIFSDDVAWCGENILLDFPTEVVDHQHKGEKFGNYLQLMSNCKHFIIPNSSFAWWAVWMNTNTDKLVIAPKNWFADPDIDTSDLVPAHWIRV